MRQPLAFGPVFPVSGRQTPDEQRNLENGACNQTPFSFVILMEEEEKGERTMRAKWKMTVRCGRQFERFSARCLRDGVTGEWRFVCTWPGGLLLLGMTHPIPELCSRPGG